ncbi:MAG: ATP-binding protein, partial [Chitinophagaceae bacterium]
NFLRFCDPVPNRSSGNWWQLRPTIRRTAVQRLHEKNKVIQALDTNNNRGDDKEQKLYECLLRNQTIYINDMPRQMLVTLSSIVDWVTGILPRIDETSRLINRAIPMADLLMPMHRLANESFVGRKNELAQLAQYIGITPTSSSAIQSATRFITQLFVSIDKNPPFLIYGPGGVGKSTLLAKFILDNTNSSDTEPLPFAYLDIDKAVIDLEWPESFVMEAARQLSTQCPEQSQRLIELKEELERHRWGFDSMEISKSYNPSASYAIPNFGIIVSAVKTPVLLVIDTFEEAQFLGEDVVHVVWKLLADLQKAAPNLRIVIAGRSQVKKSVIELHLTELSKDESRELLRKGLANLNMSDSNRDSIVDEIINIVGLNPMSLRLALTIVKDQGIDKLKKIETKTLFFIKLREEVVQARLYGRILAHIHDDEVKKLAYPGLIVRRINPEIILSVLSGPCKLEIKSIQQAEKLFDKLSDEASLMSEEEKSNALVHRSDVRKLMLEDLKSKVPAETIRSIHDLAIKFYAGKKDLISRTEEIYHRLSRGDDPKLIDSRWLDGVEPGLRTALEELPVDARIWLSGKLGVTPDSSLMKKAGLQKWEEIAARTAQRYLTNGDANKALEVMRERTERSPLSPLYRLELETLRVLGLYDEASFVAAEALAAVSGADSPAFTIVLLLQATLVKEGQGNLVEALEYIKETEKLLTDPPADILEALRIYVTHIRLLRKKGEAEDRERSLLIKKMIHLIRRKDDTDDIDLNDLITKKKILQVEPSVLSSLRSNPALLQELVAETGKIVPGLLDNAIDWLGIDVQNDLQKNLLAKAFNEWNNELSLFSKSKFGELAERAGIKGESISVNDWYQFIANNTGQILTRNIQHWRREISVSDFKNQTINNFDKALVNIFRSNVDISINKSVY